MPDFAYTAIEQSTGKEVRGRVAADSEATARAVLQTRGLVPLRLQAEDESAAQPLGDALPRAAHGTGFPPRARSAAAPSPVPPAPRKKSARAVIVIGRIVGPKELAVFTRQLSSLVKAGLPLLRGLGVLERQERNKAFRAVIAALGSHIRSGGTFSEALQQHPKVFERLYINMVRAGEAGGVLAVVLERLAQFQEKAVRLNGRIRAAMTYPLIIILVAVGIVTALMAFVVPKFEAIFATSLKGQPLPLLTELVLAASHFLKAHFLLAIGGAVLGAVLLRLAARSQRGGRVLDTLALRVPVLGDLLLKTAVARFARTFGTLLPSGVPILDALRITRDTATNARVAEAILLVHDRVKAGDSVAAPLRATRVFPDMLASMVEVGEETGALPEMLLRVADNYDEEVDNAVNALTSLIEPLMIVLMAVLVGTIVLALFLPIVRIIQSLG